MNVRAVLDAERTQWNHFDPSDPHHKDIYKYEDEPFEHFGHMMPHADIDILRELTREAFDCWSTRPGPPQILEVGSWAGQSAKNITDECEDECELYCVDSWEWGDLQQADTLMPPRSAEGGERVFRGFCRNLSDKLFTSVFPLRGRSISWSKAWPKDKKLAWVFIDGAKEDTLQDIRAWEPHIIPGGVISGHDFDTGNPEVGKAVHEAFRGREHLVTIESRIWAARL